MAFHYSSFCTPMTPASPSPTTLLSCTPHARLLFLPSAHSSRAALKLFRPILAPMTYFNIFWSLRAWYPRRIQTVASNRFPPAASFFGAFALPRKSHHSKNSPLCTLKLRYAQLPFMNIFSSLSKLTNLQHFFRPDHSGTLAPTAAEIDCIVMQYACSLSRLDMNGCLRLSLKLPSYILKASPHAQVPRNCAAVCHAIGVHFNPAFPARATISCTS
jgi:hypothetical protein